MPLPAADLTKGARLARAVASRLTANGNPHALASASAIPDTDAAAYLSARRAKTIGSALRALINNKSDVAVDDETLLDLAEMALELAHEIETFHAIDIADGWERDAEGH